jgi:hypothetical protein
MLFIDIPPLYYTDEVAMDVFHVSARPHFLCPRAQVDPRGRPANEPVLADACRFEHRPSRAQAEYPTSNALCRAPDAECLMADVDQ